MNDLKENTDFTELVKRAAKKTYLIGLRNHIDMK